MAQFAARRPGRPRSAAARGKVLAAARALIDEDGALAVTMDRLAERSGVGKPTIYRTWANRHEVVMAALMEELPAEAPSPESPSAAKALRAQLRQMLRLFATPAGRSISSLLATAEGDTEIAKAFRTHFIEARRAEGRRLIARGIAAGEFREGIDIEAALDLVYGPVFYRLLIRKGAPDAAWAATVIETLVEGIGARGDQV
jgi:AcrR family transcriptional regulator